MSQPADSELLLLALITALALPACAADIRPEPELDGGPIARVSTVRNPDGTYRTRIDATATDAWTHVDLASGGEADAAAAWDLAAQRFHLQLGGGEVAPVPGDLAEVTAIPTGGWLRDLPDGDYAFERGDGWYAYDVVSHVLTPRPLVWVLRSDGRTAVKLVIEDYYDDLGTAGVFTLRWAPL